MRYLIILTIIIFQLHAKELIQPLEEPTQIDLKKALLGKKLFFETKLSKDNTISCASCHNIAQGGDDNKRVSQGIKGQLGNLNSPTVLNSKHNFVQFWDGRAKDLKEQASGPIHNPIEMGSNLEEVVQKLKKEKEYVYRFKDVYNDTIQPEYILDAIVEFEKSLITVDAPFDLYLKGHKDAISQNAIEGYELFKSYGCISCHNGINVGGNLFQKMGILKIRKYDNKHYLGRYNVTNDEEDKYYFKVPTLRNISHTAPYFHNGEVETLRDAIKLMMEYQLGIEPTDAKIDKLLAFLKSLNGKTPKIMHINE